MSTHTIVKSLEDPTYKLVDSLGRVTAASGHRYIVELTGLVRDKDMEDVLGIFREYYNKESKRWRIGLALPDRRLRALSKRLEKVDGNLKAKEVRDILYRMRDIVPFLESIEMVVYLAWVRETNDLIGE